HPAGQELFGIDAECRVRRLFRLIPAAGELQNFGAARVQVGVFTVVLQRRIDDAQRLFIFAQALVYPAETDRRGGLVFWLLKQRFVLSAGLLVIAPKPALPRLLERR